MSQTIIKITNPKNFFYDDKAKCYRLTLKSIKPGTIKLTNVRRAKREKAKANLIINPNTQSKN